jgi:hypothetical protein
MTTLRQIEANRRNGRKSRGPKTAEGKLRSRHNARTHGLSISPMKDPSFTLEVRDLAENYIKCIGTAHSSVAVEMAIATITERRARAAGSPLWSRILTAKHLEFDELTKTLDKIRKIDRFGRRANGYFRRATEDWQRSVRN